jgi:CBS domain-containing protein
LVMYRFLEGTADQYMTRPVTTVTRETTMRELEALFEKHDFNYFPVVEHGMLGNRHKIRFSSSLCLHHWSDGAWSFNAQGRYAEAEPLQMRGFAWHWSA